MGGMEMENQPKANNMMAMFERMLQEQRTMSEIAATVERLVQRNGQFKHRCGGLLLLSASHRPVLVVPG